MGEMIRRLESQVVLSNPVDRYRRTWLPDEPTRVLILVHGFAEHLGRYDEMAMHFARRGFAVHGYDQAGHGRSPGARGHVDRFDRLSEDLVRFVELVALDHPNLPITLLGHSMGGLVAAATAAFYHPPVDRIILSGALFRLGGAGARQSLSLIAAKLLSVVAPRLAITTGLDPEGISRDPEVVRRYREDPFVKDRMSVRFAAGMNDMVQRIVISAGYVERPMLILHGADDPISSPLGSQDFFAGLRPEVAAVSELRMYANLKHEIFQEPEREDVWRDVLDWLET